MTEVFLYLKPIIYGLGIIIGAVIIGFVAHLITFRILGRLHRQTPNAFLGSLIKHARRPFKYLILLLSVNIVIPIVKLPQGLSYFLDGAFRSLFIISAAWLVIALIAVGEDVILSRYNVNVRDNLQARKIHTQTQTIRKILAVVVITVAVALVLISFDRFRELGTGILASAGLASLVIGLAAQKIFGNFLAGIQIAFTQPIRVDDVVIVENEWGRIEELTLTYVVVRIWDLRRLILPISYFIDKPFQNWTRVSADLLGTVFIYADYSISVNEVREELQRILKDSKEWDGKVSGLQVTNATERTMELRALMSTADASDGWVLRCKVREKLIEFIQKNYPEALPRTRVELDKTEAG
ncbi:mechanosensitive ion channel family protein [Chloroflexota bacterium]